jgi:hypothetical protein
MTGSILNVECAHLFRDLREHALRFGGYILWLHELEWLPFGFGDMGLLLLPLVDHQANKL